MPMQVSRDVLPPLRCELRLILEGQGPAACKHTLESEMIGAHIRKHAENCAECGEIVRELYGDKPIFS
jgi:hypothetical protein